MIAPGEGRRRAGLRASIGYSTRPGYVNPREQVAIRNTGLTGTDHGQTVYQLGCSTCGHVYGANGSDIHLRRCPMHDHGAPGLRYEEDFFSAGGRSAA